MRYKLLLVFAVFLSLNFISASIEFGNLSHNIQNSYGFLQPLKGWLNFSLNKESSESVISGFNSNISLKDFLSENNIDCSSSEKCSCFPKDCNPRYSVLGNEKNSETYALRILGSKVIGIKIKGNISKITNFGFNVSTTGGKTCMKPLVIDVLDDNALEYNAFELIQETCPMNKQYGCFNQEQVIGQTNIGDNKFCGIITIPPMKGFVIGANINGTGNSGFLMSIEAGDSQEFCRISTASGGELSCNITLSGNLDGYTNAEVCILADQDNIGNAKSYRINFEDNDTCGYIGDSSGVRHDFEIFARPLKYNSLKNFRFEQSLFLEELNLTEMIFDYIDSRFNLECSPECVIPIKFYSGVDQDLRISNLILDYEVNGLDEVGSETSIFYEINKTPSLISSGFLALDLEKANILTPNTPGKKLLVLKIGNKTINENISIINVPKIDSLFPLNPPLLTPTIFTILLSQPANQSYIYLWNFGDGSIIETTYNNTIQHVYTKMGTYDIKINITNEHGTSSKTFKINVANPYYSINNTINKYKKDLNNVESNLRALPSWIQGRINEINRIEELKSAINRQETKYKETLRDDEEEFIKIMNDLVILKIPVEFKEDFVVKPSPFIQNKDALDLAVLGDFGAGSVDNKKNNEEYHIAINQWINENIDVTLESKTYYFFYDRSNEMLFSHIKITLTPKKDIDEFYMIIDSPNIKFKEDYNEKDLNSGYGIVFSELSQGQSKTVEFLYPQKTEILSFPVYISPLFKELQFGIETGICNFNKKCEKDLGENYKNCRSDCKPWALTWTFLGILLFITFVVYIILQEWYKKHYESHLFREKNQLFNLISFMNNAKIQKISQSEIFSRLKSNGWNSEQLNYAWNKLHGKRTGMWEIPVFKPFENMRIRKEIEKRKAMNVNAKFKI